MTRDALAKVAQHAANIVHRAIGLRVVVVVTDDEGSYVGVGMSTPLEDAQGILRCALQADDQQFHENAGGPG